MLVVVQYNRIQYVYSGIFLQISIMKKYLLILLFTVAVQNIISAQRKNDSTFKIFVFSSVSPVLSYFENERYPGSSGNLKFGYGIFFRGMWYPSRLLSVGIMSGFMQISHDSFYDKITLQNVSANLSAVPLQAVVAMQKNNWEFALGIGPYLMMSSINN